MYLLEEINSRGTTVVMATHNKEIVNTMRKRVIAVEQGCDRPRRTAGEYGYRIDTLLRHTREAFKSLIR